MRQYINLILSHSHYFVLILVFLIIIGHLPFPFSSASVLAAVLNGAVPLSATGGF